MTFWASRPCCRALARSFAYSQWDGRHTGEQSVGLNIASAHMVFSAQSELWKAVGERNRQLDLTKTARFFSAQKLPVRLWWVHIDMFIMLLFLMMRPPPPPPSTKVRQQMLFFSILQTSRPFGFKRKNIVKCVCIHVVCVRNFGNMYFGKERVSA